MNKEERHKTEHTIQVITHTHTNKEKRKNKNLLEWTRKREWVLVYLF